MRRRATALALLAVGAVCAAVLMTGGSDRVAAQQPGGGGAGNAALFPLPDCLAQFVDGLLLGGFLADHTASTGGAVDQQFGNQAQGAVFACLALCLLVGNQALQGLA